MDSDLRCNTLTCRKGLLDKAVVTTCSHIFCVECANELFNASRMCPACDTSLTEPDDVVVCSLHPTNDYKTSVLSGLSPSTILEICSRAISFWQYQVHQETSYQVALARNHHDKIMQLQKKLDSVWNDAHGEINLLNTKILELERDLEAEGRKIRELQETTREKDKEYQKLKIQYDKIKRKALLVPHPQASNLLANNPGANAYGAPTNLAQDRFQVEDNGRGFGQNPGVNIGAVVGGMEANGIQRTPIVNRTGGMFAPQAQAWGGTRQQFTNGYPPKAHTTSERSNSAQEVEDLLSMPNRTPRAQRQQGTGWLTSVRPRSYRPSQRVFAPSASRRAPGVQGFAL